MNQVKSMVLTSILLLSFQSSAQVIAQDFVGTWVGKGTIMNKKNVHCEDASAKYEITSVSQERVKIETYLGCPGQAVTKQSSAEGTLKNDKIIDIAFSGVKVPFGSKGAVDHQNKALDIAFKIPLLVDVHAVIQLQDTNQMNANVLFEAPLLSRRFIGTLTRN